MKLDTFDSPRQFPVGVSNIKLSHVANIFLQPDEMVTFVREGNREYDVVAKDWGFYATPSIGGRLRRFGMRTALMRNIDTQNLFVVVVLTEKLNVFYQYLEEEHQEVIAWLDEAEGMDRLLSSESQ